MWYVFHGPNLIDRAERVAEMRAKIGEPDVASMNTSLFDAGTRLDDLIADCETMPFLAEKRLIIANNVLSGFGAAKGRKKAAEADKADHSPMQKLVEYLPTMSESARLVFLEDGLLDEKHPLLKLAADKAAGGAVKAFALPADPARWIAERAKSKGAEISPQAAQLLSTKINRGDKNDRDHFEVDSRTYLFKLDNELNKLAGYALNRRIETQDVETLVPDEDSADIFKFIDAVAARNTGEAYKVARGVIVRGESPLVVLSHLARQTRLLIQAKANAGLGPDALAQKIGVHPFVAKKALQQAGRFDERALHSTIDALLEADIAIKTGRMDEHTALDVLIAAICA